MSYVFPIQLGQLERSVYILLALWRGVTLTWRRVCTLSVIPAACISVLYSIDNDCYIYVALKSIKAGQD